MKWEKKGLIFKAENQSDWWRSHTQSPIAIPLDDNRIRIYVGAFDQFGTTRIGCVDVSIQDPKKILGISEKPILDLGRPGTFDEDGVFPASVYRQGTKIYLYYTGFQKQHAVRYMMFGGLAISEDQGNTFQRVSEVPITDRSDEGLYFRGGPSVLNENNKFKVYYSAGSEWVEVNERMRPCYNIYQTESLDGIKIPRQGTLILEYDKNREHGLGRPQIIKIGDTYQLFFCVRTLDMHYKMGCAKSENGISWRRCDEELGIYHAKEGWDSSMVYFPSIIKAGNKYFIFYCGNDYGRDGLGYAELI